jgi:hypothetical protein
VAHAKPAGWQWDPEVAALADGRFVLACMNQLPGGKRSVIAQMFEINQGGAGTKVVRDGPVITIATEKTLGTIGNVNVAGVGGSGFFASWTKSIGKPVDGQKEVLMGQFYKADGRADGAAFEIASGSSREFDYVELAESKNGAIFITWESEFDASGAGLFFSGGLKGRVIKSPAEADKLDDFLKGTPKIDILSGGKGDENRTPRCREVTLAMISRPRRL